MRPRNLNHRVREWARIVTTVPGADYYLARGMRQINAALPVELLVELDRRVDEVPFRFRNSLIIEAIRHFLTCPDAEWEARPNLGPEHS